MLKKLILLIFLLMLPLFLLISFSMITMPVTIHEVEVLSINSLTDASTLSRNIAETTVEINDDIEVIVNVPTELVEHISEQDLINIVSENDKGGVLDFQGGETITIHEVAYIETYNYKNTESHIIFSNFWSVTNRLGTSFQDFFITSIARGQTMTLTQEALQTLMEERIFYSVDSITGEPIHRVIARHIKTYQFQGPSEMGFHNSREFRIQFYSENVIWSETRVNNLIGTQRTSDGVKIQPIRFILYSIDRTIT